MAVTNDVQIAQILGTGSALRVQVFGGQLRHHGKDGGADFRQFGFNAHCQL